MASQVGKWVRAAPLGLMQVQFGTVNKFINKGTRLFLADSDTACLLNQGALEDAPW
jgi:hypothetical protein